MEKHLVVEYVPINQLKPYAGNPRIHSRQQIRQITRSLTKFGFITPVLVDEDYQIIAGHGRLLAAKELGLNVAPCICINHLSEVEKRAYLLADNKLCENAGWDPSLLRVELEYLSQIDIDIELTGFSIPEIDELLTLGNSGESEVPIPETPTPESTVTRPDDVWQLGPHRLICGDCRERQVLERLTGHRKARLVITDPPYNVRINGHAGGLGRVQHREFAMASGEMSQEAFTTFLTDSLAQFARSSLDGALHYVFMDWRHIEELLSAAQAVYGAEAMMNLCVWRKSNGGMGSLYRSQHELVFVFKKGQIPHINNVELGKNGRYRTNVWDYVGVNTFGGDRDALALHPTAKPVRLIADAMLDASKRGDIVLDGFAGAGSTLLAAEHTGRIFRGIEIDPAYVDVTARRWCDHTGEPAIHAETGQSFDEMRATRTPIDRAMETV